MRIIVALLLTLFLQQILSTSFTLEKRHSDRYLVPTDQKHSQTLIFLHGLGDSAAGMWYTFFHENKMDMVPLGTKIVLLTASMNPITIKNGVIGPSWYDIMTLDHNTDDIHRIINLQQLKKSQERINTIIEEEINILGGDSRRIALMGFSQGVLMALQTGLEFDKPLGGVAGWCGFFLPFAVENPANSELPILLANGSRDPLINLERANNFIKSIDKARHKLVKIEEPELGHAINDNVVLKTKDFLSEIFSKSSLNSSSRDL